METCIMCGASINLNTKMTIVINNQNIIVCLCDEHAEETTVKVAREKYLERKNQVELLIEQARKLGLDTSSLLGLSLTPAPAAVSTELPKEQPLPLKRAEDALLTSKGEEQPNKTKLLGGKQKEEGWISTDKYETIEGRGYTSVGGQGAASYSSYKVSGQSDVLDENLRQGKIKMGVAEGRGGSPIPVPLERVDGTGTTRIRIVNVENDQTLQRRFKGMANNHEHQPDFRQGYSDATRTCPICRGECVVNGKDCPKCKGSGLISVF